MKKFSNVIAILGLTGVLFAACDNSSSPSEGGAESGSGEINITDLKIAYIQTDSVINKFDFFIAKSEEIAEKGKKYEGELASRARGFEQEVTNFQSSANTMTINQARAKEEELVQKERNLVTYRDNVMQELSADENRLYNEVYDMIQAYLKDYAKENDLEMILSYTRGGGVWYADNALDITSSVVTGINEDLKKKQAGTGTTTTPKPETPAPSGN
ncbi:OmpH family outer membrane protein [Lunatibacter salilacus]|uniref:OmpH family outer membrane protein n=1 Tax=Lunatibacter salilacus TaxID=2483804 RepID=UPI00131EBB75|nr:OmpH family outer membrane protein [Lunatibacter salilacus]